MKALINGSAVFPKVIWAVSKIQSVLTYSVLGCVCVCVCVVVLVVALRTSHFLKPAL
jgi:hypothetical protein